MTLDASTEDLLELSFTVPPEFHGWRLDRFIQTRVPRLSRNRIQRMLRAQAKLGGSALSASSRVKKGQQISLLRPAPAEADVPLYYEMRYEDNDLLVISKPAGLPVHPTARFHRHTLTALLAEHFSPENPPRLVHRLDRETSGLLILAKQHDAERNLKALFAQRKVKKQYLAIVSGDPGEQAEIQLPIGPDLQSGIRVKQTISADGQPALTRIRCLMRRESVSLIEAQPHTGRQHQIRVHLAAIGCPIVGDKLYASDPSYLYEFLDTGWTAKLAQHLHLPRHALHAGYLSFEHPKTGKLLEIHDDLPDDLRAYLEQAMLNPKLKDRSGEVTDGKH